LLPNPDDFLFHFIRRSVEVGILGFGSRLDKVALEIEIDRSVSPVVIFCCLAQEEIRWEIAKLHYFALIDIIVLKHEALLLHRD
jgi:hypothetical protein